jgi:hypothetical protein
VFTIADWRIQRTLDNGDSEEQQRIRHYRNYLRNFTKRDTWWEAPILSMEEFNDNNNNGEREKPMVESLRCPWNWWMKPTKTAR